MQSYNLSNSHVNQILPGRPNISAYQEVGVFNPGRIVVNGTKFRPNTNIRISLVIESIGKEMSFSYTSDSNGSFGTGVPVNEDIGPTPIWMSATDSTPDASEPSGYRWSNTIKIDYLPY